MYLMHQDDELAVQAFSRSQATDPENAVAWLGQAILAIRSKDPVEAHELYQHAFEIGERSFVSSWTIVAYIDCRKLPLRGDCV